MKGLPEDNLAPDKLQFFNDLYKESRKTLKELQQYSESEFYFNCIHNFFKRFKRENYNKLNLVKKLFNEVCLLIKLTLETIENIEYRLNGINFLERNKDFINYNNKTTLWH